MSAAMGSWGRFAEAAVNELAHRAEEMLKRAIDMTGDQEDDE